MGTYLNPGNYKFQEVLASDIYVDKTGFAEIYQFSPAHDNENKTVKIPNNEIRAEYVNTVSTSDWGEVSKKCRKYIACWGKL